MADQDNRQHLLACEARYWLRQGYTTPERISELRERLRKRGEASLDVLVETMRSQWQRRREWQ